MTSNQSTSKSQVLAASFTKLLFGVLFLVGSIYTHTDFLFKLGEMCNGSLNCVFGFMSGFLLAGAGFFFVAIIIDGTIAGRQGACGLIMNIFGSILLFASIAAELESVKLGLFNLQAVPNLLGGVWAAGGILTSIGYASLAWTQKFQGCSVVIAYMLALVGSILLALAGVMRTDDVINNAEDVLKYFDTLAGVMIAGSSFFIMHAFVYGFALYNYKPDETSAEESTAIDVVFPVAPLENKYADVATA